jgi:hypothetical protein
MDGAKTPPRLARQTFWKPERQFRLWTPTRKRRSRAGARNCNSAPPACGQYKPVQVSTSEYNQQKTFRGAAIRNDAMNNKRRPALRARADGPNARQNPGMEADPDRDRFFARGCEKIFTVLVGQSCRSALNFWAAPRHRPTDNVKILVVGLRARRHRIWL